MNDLTLTEQKHVRIALLVLWRRVGGRQALAKMLRYQLNTIERATNGRREVSAVMAFRVARLMGVPLDDLLGGKITSGDVCQHCGRVRDFGDETTIVEDKAKETDV
jgi:hypothetical protein